MSWGFSQKVKGQVSFKVCGSPLKRIGEIIREEAVRKLTPFVQSIPVCPEVMIGLGVPRKPVKLIGDGEGRRLVQPGTGQDMTNAMKQLSNRFLDQMTEADGFILKSRSPSCGLYTDIFQKH